jgi:hypothetical protein
MPEWLEKRHFVDIGLPILADTQNACHQKTRRLAGLQIS